MSKVVLADAASGYNLQVINANMALVEEELNDKVLYRDNPTGEPNQMENLLDMNSHRIINLPAPSSPNDAARLADIPTVPIPIGTTTALLTTFTPSATLSSVNAQAAIEEADTENRALSASLSTAIRDDLASTSDLAKGDALIGVKRNATDSVATTLHTWIERQYFNVKDFGAVGDGSTDDTLAITKADTAACAGTLGLDGVTVVAENIVYFPPGSYKFTGNTYRGAPWKGAGVHLTTLDRYGSSGASIDCVGTDTNRKLLSITDMTINGSNATGTAYGLRLGYNQRSLDGLNRLRIVNFPGPGMYFAAPSWMLSFRDVYCAHNSKGIGSLGSAIYIDPSLAEGTLLAFNWFRCDLEFNGYASSGVGGGITIPSNAAVNWSFYGGTWESNFGNSEGRFVDTIGLHIDGLYIESEVANVANGLVFAGSAYGSVSNAHIAGETTQTGAGILASNTANVNVSQCLSNIKWTNDIKVENTAIVTMDGNNAMLLFSVANGGTLNRTMPNRQQLTDAATIAVNASLANSFNVTISDNRTMGAPTNPSMGQQILFTIIQEGVTGGHTMAWNAVYKVSWSNTGNTAGKKSTILFEYDGTNWNQVGAQSPYV